MKKLVAIAFWLMGLTVFGQVPAYYSSIDFLQPGSVIHSQLTLLLTSTQDELQYSEVWDVLKESDLETGSSTHVLLLYGSDDFDGNVSTDRTRNKDLNGGSPGEWNREHVFPKSLGDPDLGTTGPGSDAHNLRACDVTQNGNRANRKFTESSGNAGPVGNDWYPGDEWKGDCARIIMYMYVRYGNRCLPSAVGTGSFNSTDQNMMNMFLEWNVDDPVSQHEKDRNDAIFNAQGNRNPFIDNPRIAHKIWGGPLAEDTWGTLSYHSTASEENVTVYPMPVTGDAFLISGINTLQIEGMFMYDMGGKLVGQIGKDQIAENGEISVDHFNEGTYILSIIFADATLQRKIIIQ